MGTIQRAAERAEPTRPATGSNRGRLSANAAAGPSLASSAEATRLKFYTALFLLDGLCIALGFLTAAAIWAGSPFDEQSMQTLAVVVPTFIAVALNNKSYSIQALERPSFGVSRSVQALLYACAVAIALLFYLKVSAQFSRMIFALGTVLSFAALGGARWMFGNFLGKRRRWTFSNRLVIVDDVAVTPHPGDYIIFADQLGIKPGEDDPDTRHRIGKMLERFDSVVLACPPERRRKWTYSLHGCSLDVEVLMPELSRLGAVELRSLHGERTLVVSGRPLGVCDRALKRALDLIIAASALLMIAPLMLVLTIAIKVESRGPVFFRQQRIGQSNRMFTVLKFRSMHEDRADPAGTRSATPGDDRITRVGAFMRGTSLDELPQLLNVIAGDMSVVGPRPHALGSTAEDSLFWQVDRRYFQRHAIKPGMTGLAQVRGFRGATARRDDVTKRVEADLEYLSGWTIWRDLKILVGTFLVLIHPKAF
jgi:lipopolysaccharide/colanic/teichoic acid biosynthesis glycosyltransferase